MRAWALLSVLLMLAGCGRSALRVDVVPVNDKLEPQVIEYSDATWLTADSIAVIDVNGMLSNLRSGGGLLGGGSNKVSDFRETLDAIARDPAVKAVVLRINSPGGTVTASDMMYRDLQAFRAKSKKPVVTTMLDLCASGGYYLSCASDYRIAYPTTITGSIGVIVQTVNIHGTLRKIGVSTEAVKSGPNKDMASPFKAADDPNKPLSENDRELVQNLVNEFYGGFKAVVKNSPQRVAEGDWAKATDGRVFTGAEAAKIGLVDEVGDMDRAIAKAKELAGVKSAKLVMYTRKDDHKGSVYASPPAAPQPQVNMVNINADMTELLNPRPTFMYLWPGFDLQGEE